MITLTYNFIVQLPKRLRYFLLKIHKLSKSILTFLKPNDWKEEFLDCILMYTLILFPITIFVTLPTILIVVYITGNITEYHMAITIIVMPILPAIILEKFCKTFNIERRFYD